MPDEKKYNLIFEKKIKKGSEINSVKESLKVFFKDKPDTVEKLFINDSCILRRNISLSEAKKFQAIMDSMGAVCIIKEIDTAKKDVINSNVTTQSKQSKKVKNSSQITSSDYIDKKIFFLSIFLLLVCFIGIASYGKIYVSQLDEQISLMDNRIISIEKRTNNQLVKNGAFKTTEHWNLFYNGSNDGKIEITKGKLQITQGSNSVWMGSVSEKSIDLSAIDSVVLSAKRVSATHGTLRVGLHSINEMTNAPDIAYLEFTLIATGVKNIVIDVSKVSSAYLVIADGTGQRGSSVIDNISLKEVEPGQENQLCVYTCNQE